MHTSTQTVITWRNIPPTARYIQNEHPCFLLVGNPLCFIIWGLWLLVFGVIITSVTFQNLERHREGNSERYVGPILIVVGALMLARGTFNQFHRVETTRERIIIRDCPPAIYSSRQITECSSSTTATMCSVTVNDETTSYRHPSIGEDPPPYELVIADQTFPESPDTFDIVRITHRWQEELLTSEGSVASPSEPGSEPPSYDDYMKRINDTPT